MCVSVKILVGFPINICYVNCTGLNKNFVITGDINYKTSSKNKILDPLDADAMLP